MAEYIERAAAVTVCDKQYRECLRKSDFCGDTVAWNICADIKAIPAADVAPVVRCKGCKYSCEDGTGRTCEGYWHELSEFAVSVKDNDFCSHGKPKEGANADDHD